ncbi:peptidoglycan D,D-transpeptidase FtsI family protein [Pigmentibacter ruber]|uniref:peptidoglycan D,D-transpeptidase FtsI family protein n=1 Tax=Pigmentibacter ruber TaxID=2683196 RepID=UPI00131E447E|nr:penicillin-binding protein 2 [Pigmentibacter ruber]BFD30567.1 penicillin-binding protein [Pigmentibacter ruber]
MTIKTLLGLSKFLLGFQKSDNKRIVNYKVRAYVMSLIYCSFLIIILTRYAWITLFPTPLRNKLISTGSKQFETNLMIAPPRASITDRNGRILAVSISRPSIYLLTKKMPNDVKILAKVAEQINIPLQDLLKFSTEKRNFIWLKRQISFNEFHKMGSLKKWQDFIGIIDESKRFYPEKDLAAQLIGFVGSEGNGLEGIEKIYNSRLNLKPLKSEVMKDARGRLVMSVPNDASKPEQIAPNLKLSIDLSIQEFTQNALKEGVVKAKAKGGSAIVMDVKTGELLSIASYPSYDLNNPPENDPSARRFRPVMDAIELGSVVKPMWIAKALDMKVINQETKVYAENGQMSLPGGIIHDTHPHGWITPEEVLKVSSNIGAYKVVQKIGRETFFDSLMKIGFGRAPGTGLPGEWSGRIKNLNSWREMNFANMAFGQGFAISPLQLAHALSIIVGDGTDHGVNLISLSQSKNMDFTGPPLKYISNDTSKKIAKMMESVVEEEGGTGSPARIPGLLVAGKTGTAQIWSQKDHSYSGRTAVFEGVIPSDNPKLAIVVVIDEAGVRPAYGGPLAGPVFAEIGKKTVQYLNSKGIFNVIPYENAYLRSKSRPTNEAQPKLQKSALVPIHLERNSRQEH